MTGTRPRTPDEDEEPAATAAAFLAGQEITTTGCGRCGTEVSGVNGRYACGNCGWVNHWSEGHTDLPPLDVEEDGGIRRPDDDGRGRE